jgi:hypothetical protein
MKLRCRRKVTTLLCQAAELAIRQKTERLSADLIEQAVSNGIYKYTSGEPDTAI